MVRAAAPVEAEAVGRAAEARAGGEEAAGWAAKEAAKG